MPEHRALGWLSWPLPVDEAIVIGGGDSSDPYRGLSREVEAEWIGLHRRRLERPKMIFSISIRHYFSIRHLSAAALFARQCREAESSLLPLVIEGPEWQQHSAASVSAVVMSAAFLEATINEIYSDCVDDPTSSRLACLPARALMEALWKQGIPRRAGYPIVQKYEIALELNGKPAFDHSRSLYQDARHLVELRNALVHFEPKTITSTAAGGKAQAHKFDGLKSKFPDNALAGAGNPYYPDKLLGAGCAEWAVKSAVAFTDEFFGKLGMEPTYEHARAQYLGSSSSP